MKPLLSIIPEPDRSTEARKPLTPKQRAEIALRQGGRCGCKCGAKLDHAKVGTIDEHIIPLALGGSNDLTNRALYAKPCAMKKTATADQPAIAKAKRNEARDTGTRRERQPIPSRGFSTRTRKMDGTIGLTKKALRYLESTTEPDDGRGGYDDGAAGGMNP